MSQEQTLTTENLTNFKLGIQNSAKFERVIKNMADLDDSKRRKFERKKYEQLLAKVSFLDLEKPQEERRYNYNYEGMLPYVFFFKYLAQKPDDTLPTSSKYTRLKLWLPDTIVLNERNDLPPMWFYTSEDGYVYRTDTFTIKNVVTKLSNYASPDELVAVIKKVLLLYLA